MVLGSERHQTPRATRVPLAAEVGLGAGVPPCAHRGPTLRTPAYGFPLPHLFDVSLQFICSSKQVVSSTVSRILDSDDHTPTGFFDFS